MVAKDENIVLIGMPACGKSTCGKVLAERLNRKFIDTDDIICKLSGMPIPKLLERRGEEVFRDYEKEALENVLSEKGTVIATGGSAIYQSEMLSLLSNNSKFVYIDVPFNVIANRCKSPKERGVITSNKTFKELYDERDPLYKSIANLIIYYIDNDSVESIVKRLEEFLV